MRGRGKNKRDIKGLLSADDAGAIRDIVPERATGRRGGVFELDSVDWSSVARAYKILRLYPRERESCDIDEQLQVDYHRWIAMSGNRIEFEIALRMYVEESDSRGRQGDPFTQPALEPV